MAKLCDGYEISGRGCQAAERATVVNTVLPQCPLRELPDPWPGQITVLVAQTVGELDIRARSSTARRTNGRDH